MTSASATVELLTAQVRILQVGSRQVTLSVYRQLDQVPAAEIEPFGRVQDRPEPGSIEVVGSHRGALARSVAARCWCGGSYNCTDLRALHNALRQLILDDQQQRQRLAGQVPGQPPWAQPGMPRPLGLSMPPQTPAEAEYERLDGLIKAHETHQFYRPSRELYERWAELPLIVLAGLR